MREHDRPVPRLVPHADDDRLAEDTARRILEVLERAQDERGEATIALTGGSMGTRVIREVATHPDAQLVDWPIPSATECRPPTRGTSPSR